MARFKTFLRGGGGGFGGGKWIPPPFQSLLNSA
jgi:hypothetical protein